MGLLLRVALFLRVNAQQFGLSPIQKVMLYTLAGHIGKNKKWTIRQSDIARECEITPRCFQINLKVLIDKKIIIREKIINKKGKQNTYSMNRELLDYTNHDSHSQDDTMRTAVRVDTPPMRTAVRKDTRTTVRIVPPVDTSEALMPCGLAPIPISPKETYKTNLKINKTKDTSDSPSRFDEFWKEYPCKEAKKKAKAIWLRNKLDLKADMIIADVVKRKACHKKWLEGYVPHPTTYLNGERWTDEITEVNHAEGRPTGQLSPHQASLQRGWDVIKNGNWH